MWLMFVVSAGAAELVFHVEGLRSDAGMVWCMLYDAPDEWRGNGEARAITAATPQEGVATCSFGERTTGEYAVSYLHDENGNQRMDLGPLGLPIEVWGVSGDARSRMKRPAWRRAAFFFTGQPLSTAPRVR